MPAVTRRRVLTILRIAVSLALLAVLFWRVDLAALGASARRASPLWLTAALSLYVANVLASTWRWGLLLDAQGLHVRRRLLLSSYLVAGFFNNFLPSNIGGDVIRIRDTASAARSKTLATTVVLVDRLLGLMGLVFVAAVGATVARALRVQSPPPIWPAWLWAGFIAGAAAAAPAVLAPAGVGRLLQPLTIVHPTWVGTRIEKLTSALARFREHPGALAACFGGAVLVQALLVSYYAAVARALGIPITIWDLAVLVPLSFLVQMLPVSVNGFGVREATFAFYFSHLGLPVESAVLLSLMATGVLMLFSLSGAAVYVSRSGTRPALDADAPARG
jgi:uncharacterized membrane protein YbhN (UPF0104 family)